MRLRLRRMRLGEEPPALTSAEVLDAEASSEVAAARTVNLQAAWAAALRVAVLLWNTGTLRGAASCARLRRAVTEARAGVGAAATAWAMHWDIVPVVCLERR